MKKIFKNLIELFGVILIASFLTVGLISAFTIDSKTYEAQDDGETIIEDIPFTETKTVTENVGTYNDCIRKLTTWQERVTKQQALCDGMESDKDKLPARQ